MFQVGWASFWKDDAGANSRSLGRNETVGGRDADMEGPSLQGPMQRQIHASRGLHWNKQSYATGGSSRGDKFHPEFMIVVRDMVGDGVGRL